jgi:hypothetical protein
MLLSSSMPKSKPKAASTVALIVAYILLGLLLNPEDGSRILFRNISKVED